MGTSVGTSVGTCVGDASMDDPAAEATVGVTSVGHGAGDSTAIWRV